MIKNLPYSLFSEELIAQLKDKKIHVICKADNNDNAIVEELRKKIFVASNGNEDRSKVIKLIDLANEKKEAALLYPSYYIGIYPTDSYETEEEFIAKFKVYLHDLFIIANEKYLRSKTIVFVMEHETLAYAKTLVKLMNDFISKNRSEIKYLQEVFVTPDCK
jgi:ssDNA-binding Zn-finger/Zn-ribbon topoisomerase 1